MARRNSKSHEFSSSMTHHIGPVVVWLVAVICVVALFYQRSQRIEVLGLTRGRVYVVASAATGRLIHMAAGLFEAVQQGQVVAVVDTLPDNDYARTLIQERQETIKAQMTHLAAQLLPTQERLSAQAVNQETSLAADVRRFALDVENTKLWILELRTRIETDRIAARAAAAEIETTRGLVDQDVIDASELLRVQLEHDGLTAMIRENERLLAQAQTNQAQATERLNQFSLADVQTPSVENALEVIRKEIDVFDRRFNELMAELSAIESRKAVKILAPFDGIISQVHGTVGGVVDVNQPILTITEDRPSEVVAYINEYLADEIEVGMEVQVVKMGVEVKMIQCEVSAIGPRIEQLPQQLWRSPTLPQWGRPFLIKTDSLDLLDLATGEKVGVRRL